MAEILSADVNAAAAQIRSAARDRLGTEARVDIHASEIEGLALLLTANVIRDRAKPSPADLHVMVADGDLTRWVAGTIAVINKLASTATAPQGE